MGYIARVIKGPRLRVAIDSLDDAGAGVGTVEGLRIHVAYALPGEVVEATIAHRSPHQPEAWARLDTLEVSSPDRVGTTCLAWGRCGGCVLQHYRYARQTEWKRALVAEALGKAGVKADVMACVPSPAALGYRENAKLVFASDGRRVYLGAYAPRSHRVVNLDRCAVVEEPLDAVARALGVEATRLGLSVYDGRQGILRYVLLRVNARGEVLALLVVGRRDPVTAELARALRRARPEVVGVVENLQRSGGNVLVGNEERDLVLDGADCLWDDVGPVRVRLSARAFSQSNRAIAARLYAGVARAAALRTADRVIDAYAGAGGIALTLAHAAAATSCAGVKIRGFEENFAAVDDARAGAVASQGPEVGEAGVEVHFVAGDAARLLSDAAAAGEKADIIVLDPPRRGCPPGLLKSLPTLGPRRILYVSCAPETLARDLAVLASLGYRTVRVTPYDMLPHTPHVEALAEVEPA